MSNFDPEQPCFPGNTYVPVKDPQLKVLSRQLFLISVGSAAVPVLVAAVIMLRNEHGFVSKAAPSLSARSSSPHLVVARGEAPHTSGALAKSDAATRLASMVVSDSPMGEEATASPSRTISSERFPGMPDVASSLQGLQAKSDLFQQSDMLRLALIPVPETSSIQEAATDAAESRGADTLTAASQPKKIRAESKARPLARHHYRSQKHQPPNLLAKIGQSVKNGLTQLAKFPRQAMEGRLGE